MPQPHPPPAGGFSLFPNTDSSQRPPSRNQASRSASRARTTTPQPGQGDAASSAEMSPPKHQRKPSVRRQPSVSERRQPSGSHGGQPATDGRNSALDRREEESVISRPAPVAVSETPPRCDTAFSQAQTLVRSNSARSRSSIAKPPILYDPPLHPDARASSSQQEAGPVAIRSMFPTYNPSVPLDRQEYYPTQASPTHIPRAAISRPLYSPEPPLGGPGPALVSPTSAAAPVNSGQTTTTATGPAAAPAAGRWPPRATEPTPIPETSTTADLQGLWKVANGWKASPSEGRTYCLRMTPEPDAPVYTLSSATQPFYHLRLDPTSASAYVTLSRHDPHKTIKSSSSSSSSASASASPPRASSSASSTSSSSPKPDAKNWSEALCTTLEEEARRHAPNDGLVALLYPTAATKMALDRPGDAAAVARAEAECARLVWDGDARSHFLVHPALALPFCVTVERNPAWSRTEYTLEHLESPRPAARLTRDGTGAGWLEVDTSVAARMDAVFFVDVAVAALMLVAHKDTAFAKVEVFEPPPVLFPSGGGSSVRSLRNSSRLSMRTDRKEKDKRRGGASRMEEFEIDVESQSSGGQFGWGKVMMPEGKRRKGKKEKKDKLPFVIRAVLGLFKAAFWVLTIGFRALAAIVSGLAKCLHAEKR